MFKIVITTFAAISTFGIGLAAAFIAYQQSKVSKTKLRFDLFDRRYALFFKLRIFASDVAVAAKTHSEFE